MNYIREINSFMDWLEINPLEANTQALWFHIMAIANKSGWPEWFTIANLTLMAKVGISENTLNKHRNILIQKGRIEYKNQGKQKAGKYRIISFTSNTEVKQEDNNSVTSNNEVSHEVNHEVNREVNPSALYKLNETKQNICNSTTTETEEESFDEEFKELAKLYQKCGFDVNGLTPDWLTDLKDRYGFEWTKNAIFEAERKGKRSKDYVEGILRNWKVGGGMKLSTDQDKIQNTVQAKKTKFHNFKQRSDKYSEDQLEAIAERKRQEYIDKLKKQSEAF